MARPNVQITSKERFEILRSQVILPKPGELVKTTPELCSHCQHACVGSGYLITCDYVINTGKVRGCKQGECDKFIEFIGKNKNNWLTYGKRVG